MSSSHPSSTSTLHLTAIPPGSHIGLDLSSFTSTPTFLGITSLPPGLHHIWISPAPSLSLRHGTWLHCTPGSTHHLHYDPQSESLHPASVPVETVMGGSTPYRQRSVRSGQETSSAEEWQGVVAHVTPEVLTRVLGRGWSVATTSSAPSSSPPPTTATTTTTTTFDLDTAEPEIIFAPIDLRRTWPTTAIGRERTEKARDRSWALSQLPSDIQGEFELSFITCHLLGNFSAGEQWRNIVTLALTCRSAVVEREGWFVSFLRGLRLQMEVLSAAEDGGFLGDEVLGEVVRLLRKFGGVVRQLQDDGEGTLMEVEREFGRLKEWGERKMDWVLDTRDAVRRGFVQTEDGDMVELQEEGLEEEEESGDYAPVVVELAESTRSDSPFEVQIVHDNEDDDPRF